MDSNPKNAMSAHDLGAVPTTSPRPPALHLLETTESQSHEPPRCPTHEIIRSMTNKSAWRRVSKRERCPICGKPDWCLVCGPEGSPEAAICPRIESATKIDKGGRFSGYLHRLRESTDSWKTSFRSYHINVEKYQPRAAAE
jgi:hypothetical protein